ncbi:MAG: DUF6446 family protein [Sulfitobacter sp.]
MNGKIVGGTILISAAIAGAALYYLQEFGFYRDASVDGAEVQLTSLTSGLPEPILTENFRAIDADSSPIRYRACFDTSASFGMLTETYVGVDDIVPRNAPGWFDCFDAAGIAAELDAGTALMFLGQKNIAFGVDRVVAISESGRGYVWHELNECGDKAYDGTIVGEECPQRPEAN